MKLNFSLFIKDPKGGKKSVTTTLLVAGFCVCMLKLILSGMLIAGTRMEKFNASEAAILIGALGGLYFGRRWSDSRYPEEPREPRLPRMSRNEREEEIQGLDEHRGE